MKTFTKQEVELFLTDKLSGWTFGENTITRDFKFKTFVEAFSFMAAVALEAEKLNHHPDWSNSYNKVSVVLTNHEAKGVTQLDFELADKVDQIFKKYSS